MHSSINKRIIGCFWQELESALESSRELRKEKEILERGISESNKKWVESSKDAEIAGDEALNLKRLLEDSRIALDEARAELEDRFVHLVD